MRPHSDELERVLKGSLSRKLLVDVFHGSNRVAQELVATDWQFDGNLDTDIKHAAAFTLVLPSIAGESYLPEGVDGTYSPFRATAYLSIELSAGEFSERVGLGWGRMAAIPVGRDVTIDASNAGAGEVSVVTVLRFEWESFESKVKRRGFRFPEQAPSLSSTYSELRRITDMPVAENVPDKPLPVAPAYEAREGGRLRAVQMLYENLGGIGVVSPSGEWTCVPHAWSETVVGKLYVGPDGTVTDIPYSIDTTGIYNVIVGNFEDPVTRQPLTAVAVDNNSAIAVGTDYGENTGYISDDLVTTQAAANAAVERELAKVRASQQYEVPVQCIINPLLELGDIISVEGWKRPLVGRVKKYSLSDSALMTVTLEARRAL